MHHAAQKWDCNCVQTCSTCYGLRSSVPKKPVKPIRKTRNSNKVLMNINLDSLLAGNCQKNAQKRQEEVVVVDSEMETVTESTDNELKKPNAPKKVDSGSNKEIESTEEPKDNETENIATENKENANQVVIESTEEPKINKTENIENNAMDVTETEQNKENRTVDIENTALDVTETEPNKENKTENIENNAMDVTETEPNKENKTATTLYLKIMNRMCLQLKQTRKMKLRKREWNTVIKMLLTMKQTKTMKLETLNLRTMQWMCILLNKMRKRECKMVQVTTLILNKTRKIKTEK